MLVVEVVGGQLSGTTTVRLFRFGFNWGDDILLLPPIPAVGIAVMLVLR